MAITAKDTFVRDMVEEEKSVLADWICCFPFHRTHPPKPQKKNLFPTSECLLSQYKNKSRLNIAPYTFIFIFSIVFGFCFTSTSTKGVVSTNVYKPFWRNNQGRRGGGVALCIREGSDCLELNDGNYRVKCLQERIRGKGNKTDNPTRMKRWTKCWEKPHYQ